VVNGSLEFDTATLSPTYRFRKGTPGRSYGLAIARRLGLDPSLVARAEDRVPAQERALDSLLATVEARARDLRVREAEAALGLETVERKETDLAAAKTEVEARTRRLRQRERDAERAAREQARAYLLAARKTIEDAIRRAETAGVDAPAEARRLVEDAIRDTAISGDDADAADGAETDHVLAAGSKVRLAGGAVGRVEEIRGDGRLAVRAGTVRMVVLRSNVLEVLSEDQTDSRSDGRRDARTVDREGSASLEIDLRGMRADEAESTTIAALDAAVVADQPFLRIIHGRGTGAVRERVHQVVKADRRVARFALAPANQGGAGVTVVEFAS
jgi:DNA mismatch repair protein MutS2